MKYRTYNNMYKATKMIANKGYDLPTANEIAMQCFDTMKQTKNGMPVEWFIEKVREVTDDD
jgi:hypothetical protein